MEPKISAAIAECFSSALSTLCWILEIAGNVRQHTIRMKSIAELVARVRAHEYLKAMMYAAIKRARDWNKMASLSEILC